MTNKENTMTPDRPTDADLDQWQTLADAAAPAPWGVETYKAGRHLTEHKAVRSADNAFYANHLNPATAEFIAAARTALPALITEVRRLRTENTRLRNHKNRNRDQRDDARARLAAVEALVSEAEDVEPNTPPRSVTTYDLRAVLSDTTNPTKET